MDYLQFKRMGSEKIVYLAREHGRFHGTHPRTGELLQPLSQRFAISTDYILINNLARDGLDAVSNSSLVDIQADVVHCSHGSLLVGLTRGDSFDPARSL